MRVDIGIENQKKLIESAKVRNDFTWKRLAELLSVSEGVIRSEWRHGKNLLPLHAYQKLSELSGSDFQIIRKLNDNWGRRKGALISNKSRAKIIKSVKNDVKFSELIGIILGDGSIFSDNSKNVHYLRIFFHSEKEIKYAKYVKSLITDVFGIVPRLRRYKDSKCIYLSCDNKSLVDHLTHSGFVSGSKIRNSLTIPKWIVQNKEFLRACLRGLIDTDGSIYKLKPNWPKTIQIQFKNHNTVLLKDTRNALIGLGYSPSKIHQNRLVITKQKEVKLYLSSIGTRSKKIAP